MEQGSFDFCCFVFLSVCAYARAAATGFAMPGLIPDWFGLQLPSLQVLDLRSCLIHGAIPLTLGNLSSATEFDS